jgi:chitinase
LVSEILEKDLERMVSTIKRRGSKILFSVGGYDHPDEPFSRLVANETSRKNFIENSIKFLKRNGFDGLDIFWYSPVYWSDDNRNNSADKKNFLHFIKETSAAFKKQNLLLTTEVSGLTDILNVAFDLEEMSKHVDLIHLVSWDLTGYWSGITGLGNPITRRDRGGCFSLVIFRLFLLFGKNDLLVSLDLQRFTKLDNL